MRRSKRVGRYTSVLFPPEVKRKLKEAARRLEEEHQGAHFNIGGVAARIVARYFEEQSNGTNS